MKKENSKSKKSVVKKIFLTLCISMSIFFGSILSIFVFMYATTDLNVNTITDSNMGVSIYDKNDNVIETNANSSKKLITLSTLPDYVPASFISIEDKGFYKHNGIQPHRILKAILVNMKSGGKMQGASTITQQLIKNTLLTSEKTYSRKIKEIILAIKLENKLSKDEILEQYLNTIYFGENCYGIENASQLYFNKSARSLTIEESAMLAGMIKAPNTYSPCNNAELAKKRRDIVLTEMAEDKKISIDILNKSKKSPIALSATKSKYENGYIQIALQEAYKILNISEKDFLRQGYKVVTYLDPAKQKTLENVTIINDDEIDAVNSLQIVCDNETGGIEAYYGNANLSLNGLHRQPASTIKPLLVYLPALDSGMISPATPILDEKINSAGYVPRNYNNKFAGWTNARYSLEKSLNIPAIKIMSYITVDEAAKMASKLNIELEENDKNMTLALGSIGKGVNIKALVSGYSAIARGGKHIPITAIKSIKDKNGKEIYKHVASPTEIAKEDSCYLLTDMLRPNNHSNTTRPLKELNIDVASKTGTASINGNSTDYWNVAYTQEHTIGSWLGVIDNGCAFPENMTSSIVATNMTKEVLSSIYHKHTPPKFVRPDSVVEVKLSKDIYDKNHILKKAIESETYFTELFSSKNLPSGAELEEMKIEEYTPPETKNETPKKTKKRWWYI